MASSGAFAKLGLLVPALLWAPVAWSQPPGERSFAPLVKAVEPAVVAIEVNATVEGPDVPAEVRELFDPRLFGPQRVQGEGSGFVVSADGLVLTNAHVVEDADEVKARFSDGRVVVCDVVGSDPDTDVALLRLQGNERWPFVPLGSSEDLQVGDWVVAAGNPLGLGLTVTAGIVSAKGRALGIDAFDDFVQVDAAINLGNSGGPLFDLDGRVVGITTVVVEGANTIGFAVPIDLAKEVLQDLKEEGRVARGYVGLASQPLDEALGEVYGVPPDGGALVAEVQSGSPAARAGLRPGDVITAVDGAAIDGPAPLARDIARRNPGETVTIAYQRDGRSREARVKLGERPRPEEAAAGPAAPEPERPGQGQLGLGLATLDPDLARRAGLEGGVVVTAVDPSGPAAGRIEEGDVVLEVGGEPVSSAAEARERARAAGDQPVLFLLVREGRRMFVAVPTGRPAS